MGWLWGSNRSANRLQSISRADLQSAIAEAVKKSDPVCECFVAVIIERVTPKSKLEANWDIKGIKFGLSDRAKSNEAIEAIVARMKREFVLAD